jgi:hypothetical protein
MEFTLYGMPHLFVQGPLGRASQAASDTKAPLPVVSPLAATRRDITLGMSHEIIPSSGADQIVEVTVESLEDTQGVLTPSDVTSRQEISFGRPQLPSLSFDAVYASNQVPRGVVVLEGTMADYPFNPTITRIVTEQLYDPTEPGYSFDQWFPTQPVKVNRLGSSVGTEENEAQLVLYPAQVKATSPDEGTLRIYESLKLRIFYEDVNSVGDWQAPVIHLVEVVPGEGQVDITMEVTDPDPGVGTPSGVSEVLLAYSTDGVSWVGASPSQAGDVWTITLSLPAGSTPNSLSFVVQAVDGAGNVAYSSNKGEDYSGAGGTVFFPLVVKVK